MKTSSVKQKPKPKKRAEDAAPKPTSQADPSTTPDPQPSDSDQVDESAGGTDQGPHEPSKARPREIGTPGEPCPACKSKDTRIRSVKPIPSKNYPIFMKVMEEKRRRYHHCADCGSKWRTEG